MFMLIVWVYVVGAVLSARWFYGRSRARIIDRYVTRDKYTAVWAVRRFDVMDASRIMTGALMLGGVWPGTWAALFVCGVVRTSKVRSRAEKAADLHGDSVG